MNAYEIYSYLFQFSKYFDELRVFFFWFYVRTIFFADFAYLLVNRHKSYLVVKNSNKFNVMSFFSI